MVNGYQKICRKVSLYRVHKSLNCINTCEIKRRVVILEKLVEGWPAPHLANQYIGWRGDAMEPLQGIGNCAVAMRLLESVCCNQVSMVGASMNSDTRYVILLRLKQQMTLGMPGEFGSRTAFS
jgi:hypothetical protein